MKYDCPEKGCDYTTKVASDIPTDKEVFDLRVEQHKRSHKPPIKVMGWQFKPYQDAQIGTINVIGHMSTSFLMIDGQKVHVSFGQTPQGILISVKELGDFLQPWNEVLGSVKPALRKAMGKDVCAVCAGTHFKPYMPPSSLIQCEDCGNAQSKEASE